MIESIADLKLEFQTKRDIEARLLKKVCELTIVYYRIDNPEECYRHNISQLQNVTGKEHERKWKELTALTAAIIIGMLNLDAAFDDTTMENLIDQAIDNLEDKLKGSFKAHSPTIIKKKSESPIKDEMRTGN